MKISAATLADYAEVLNGKLYLMGGAFDTIQGRSLPVTHKRLFVVLIAEVSPEERLKDIHYRVELVDEDGASVGPGAIASLRVGAPPSMKPGQSNVVPMAIPFENLEFPQSKMYAFRVSCEEEELARVSFSVRLSHAGS
jgi:hypothetical protein